MNESARELHDYVSRVKVSPEVREEYMRFEELIAFERKEAAQEATEKAQKAVQEATEKAQKAVQEATEKAQKTAQEATHKNTIQYIFDFLEDYGEIPDALKEKLGHTNLEVLGKYVKLAARADSIEAFMEMIE